MGLGSGNHDGLGLIGKIHGVFQLLRGKDRGEEKSIHRKTVQGVDGGLHIVGVSFPEGVNYIGFGDAVFRCDGNGHIGGAVGSEGVVGDGDGGVFILRRGRNLEAGNAVRHRGVVAGGAGGKSRGEGGVAYLQGGQIGVAAERRSNGGGVGAGAHVGVGVAVAYHHAGCGHRDGSAGGSLVRYQEGGGPDGAAVQRLGHGVVIEHEIVSGALHHPGGCHGRGEALEGQHLAVVLERAAAPVDTAPGGKAYGDGITCPDGAGAGELGAAGRTDRKTPQGKDKYGPKERHKKFFHFFTLSSCLFDENRLCCIIA